LPSNLLFKLEMPAIKIVNCHNRKTPNVMAYLVPTQKPEL